MTRVLLLLLLCLTLSAWAQYPNATPAEKDLIVASRSRYPGQPDRGGPPIMGWYAIVPYQDRYFAHTEDGTAEFEENRALDAVWEYKHGAWSQIDSRPGVTYTPEIVHKLGFSQAMWKRLGDAPRYPLRPCECRDNGPATPLVRSLKRAVEQRYPGAGVETVTDAFVTPYKDTAFGITCSVPVGLYAPHMTVWEKKGRRWSYVFDYYWWPGTYSPKPSKMDLCLDDLYARHQFSSAMRQKLMSGIYRKLAP